MVPWASHQGFQHNLESVTVGKNPSLLLSSGWLRDMAGCSASHNALFVGSRRQYQSATCVSWFCGNACKWRRSSSNLSADRGDKVNTLLVPSWPVIHTPDWEHTSNLSVPLQVHAYWVALSRPHYTPDLPSHITLHQRILEAHLLHYQAQIEWVVFVLR